MNRSLKTSALLVMTGLVIVMSGCTKSITAPAADTANGTSEPNTSVRDSLYRSDAPALPMADAAGTARGKVSPNSAYHR